MLKCQRVGGFQSVYLRRLGHIVEVYDHIKVIRTWAVNREISPFHINPHHWHPTQNPPRFKVKLFGWNKESYVVIAYLTEVSFSEVLVPQVVVWQRGSSLPAGMHAAGVCKGGGLKRWTYKLGWLWSTWLTSLSGDAGLRAPVSRRTP